VVAVAELFALSASGVVVVTVAVFTIVPPAATEGKVLTVSVNTALPTLIDAFEQVSVSPAEPTAGVMHDQPPGWFSPANTVPGGIVSVSDTVAAASGPLLVTVMV
jgi:hypothetical protein